MPTPQNSGRRYTPRRALARRLAKRKQDVAAFAAWQRQRIPPKVSLHG